MIHIVLATMFHIQQNPMCLVKFKELEMQVQQTKETPEAYCDDPPNRRAMKACEDVIHECAIEED